MIAYKIEVVDKNSEGDVIRCPKCGQVLMILNDLGSTMRTTVQCRRCHSLTEVCGTKDDIREYGFED